MEQVEKKLVNEQPKNYSQSVIDIGSKGIKATGQILNKVLDLADSIDRFFNGYQLKLFIGLSLLVVVFAPIIDWARNDWRDRVTTWSTIGLLIFLMIMLFAWIGSLRDDEGNWSLRRVRNRIWTYAKINFNFFNDSFKLPKEEMLYRLSTLFVIGSFCWKALQNVSVIVRKFYESFFHTRWDTLRSFERITNNWSFWVFLIGFGILIYLISKNKNKIFNNLTHDFFPFLIPNKKDKIEISQIKIVSNEFVYNAKDKNQIASILNSKNPELFNEFIKTVQKWTPKNCLNEDDFENKLHECLKRNMPHATVERQRRIIVDPSDKRKDRKADIVIDDTILVELKKEFQTTATDRATTQVWEYSKLWGDKGPVFLLLCEANYEQAKLVFNPKLKDLAKLDYKIIALVANPK